MKTSHRYVAMLLLSAIASNAQAEDESTPPPTHTAKVGPIKRSASLQGVFSATRTDEVKLSAEAWTSFTIQELIEPGTRVAAGDLLVSFESDEIERAMEEAQYELETSQLDLEQTRADLQAAREALELDLAEAERTHEIAQEAWTYFQETERTQNEESARWSVRFSEQSLRYAQEEFDQLSKMYAADDLTEETEEIILERARNDLDRGEYNLKNARINSRRSLETEIPRRAKSLEIAAERAEAALEKARRTAPAGVRRQEIALAKAELAHRKLETRLARLRADRELMDLRSPADGVVYYGRAERGEWDSGVASRLRVGGKPNVGEVLMTIVAPWPIELRAKAGESDLAGLRPGLSGAAIPTARPETRIAARVDTIGVYPLPGGGFDVRIAVDLGEEASIAPGMTAQASFVSYKNPTAVLVPESAVFRDFDDESKRYVWLVRDGEAPVRQPVELGVVVDGEAEIRSGLSAGDVLLQSQPE